MRILIFIALILTLLGACDVEVVEEWHLDHDRVIAVRATPPGIIAGQTAELDALLGHEGAAPTEAIPEEATVVSPRSLASALAFTGGRWVVTAPDDATLASVRSELGLAPTAPVPLVVSVRWPPSAFPSDTIGADYAATKTVVLGDERANPVLSTMTVDGAAAFESRELVVDVTEETTLAIPAEREDVTRWLTSCGELADWDLASTLLTFEDDDACTGNISVVRRTRAGGVAWKTWAIRAE